MPFHPGCCDNDCDDDCNRHCDRDCKRCERGERGKRGKRGHSGPLALKWSGLVNENALAITRNLADPGTDVAAVALVENRYPLCLHHKAVSFAIRSMDNNLTVPGAVVQLLKNGGVFAAAAVPPTGITTVNALPDVPFAPGDDIEVQVVIPLASNEGNFVALTVVVELI